MIGELLSDEEVRKAVEREGVHHPLIELLEAQAPELRAFLENYSLVEGNAEQQHYICQNFGFLADGVERTGHFSVDPLDIISLWSTVDELKFPMYPRYATTRIVGHAYASLPLPTRAGSTKWGLENEWKFRDGFFRSREDVQVYQARLKQLNDNLKEISFYRFGGRGVTSKSLFDRMNSPKGEESFRPALELSSTPFMKKLGEINENFNNGLSPLSVWLYSLKLESK